MAQIDSVDKIVKSYFASVTAEPFTYKNETYHPRPLYVSPLLLRGYTCPEGCAACCPRFSLDYLPKEKRPYKMPGRTISIAIGNQHHEIQLYSDMQSEHSNYHCKNLIHENGRCGIHGTHPFSCDFELIRFMTAQPKPDAIVKNSRMQNVLTQKLYGRAWNMKRVDNERGTLCEMTTPDEASKKEVVRKLRRLAQWLEHFQIKKHKVQQILDWVELPGYRTAPIVV